MSNQNGASDTATQIKTVLQKEHPAMRIENVKVLTLEDIETIKIGGVASRYDETPFLETIKMILEANGGGGSVTLDDEDEPKQIRRRLQRANKQLNPAKRLYFDKKSPADTVTFTFVDSIARAPRAPRDPDAPIRRRGRKPKNSENGVTESVDASHLQPV